MKTLRNIFRSIPAMALALFVLVSCSREPGTEPPAGDRISFKLQLPEPNIVETRSESTSAENQIDNITILGFNASTKALVFIESGSTPELDLGSQDRNVWGSTASIIPGTYDLWAVANDNGMLDAISVEANMDKTSVAKTLVLENTGKWIVASGIVKPIPMWGELTGITIDGNSTPAFDMIRMLARINVSVQDGVGFDLRNISFYNRNTKGCLVPDPARLPVGKPTDYGLDMGKSASAVTYSYGTDFTNAKACLNSIYVFEAESMGIFPSPGENWENITEWQTNPCLVIGGIYDPSSGNSTETFYRVDLISDYGSGSEVWYPLLRNHSYNVVIRSVKGPGYGNAANALRSAPENMDVSAYIGGDYGMAYVTMVGPYYLMVSAKEISTYFTNRTTTVTMKTDYPDWQVTMWNNEACTQPMTDNWMTASPTGGNTSYPAEYVNVGVTISGSTPGSRYIKITAGRMSMVIKVTLLPTS